MLNINFRTLDELFSSINTVVSNGKKIIDHKEIIFFDSEKTFHKFMSQNKLQILKAISRLKPESVYQLAKFVGREYPHVLKDCRALESFSFIKLVEVKGLKKQLAPRLSFDYDIIKVNSAKLEMIEVINISKKSNQIILEEASLAV